MKVLTKFCFTLFCSLFTTAVSAQYIQVNDTYTAQQMVEALVDNSCAQVSNITVSGWSGGGGGNSYGYFTAGPEFPFQNGIILSSGFAASAQGPNTMILSDGNNGWAGDAELEAALGTSNSFNATVLEFDFIPSTNRISFDYMFSSEEYTTNWNTQEECDYSDGFVFLLKEAGSAAPYRNLAIIPDTEIPVKVTSVRGVGFCPSANEEYFGAFNGDEHPTNFNGQTVILTARADVVAGTLYHIKLAIADQGDTLYDSAIFLGGGSFNAGVDIGEDRLFATGNPVCAGGTVTLNATSPGAIGYQWFENDILLPGETFPVYIAGNESTYKVEVAFSPTCISTGEIQLDYAVGTVTDPGLIQICDDATEDGLAEFDLTPVAGEILTGLPPGPQVDFYTSYNDALTFSNPIAAPAQFRNTVAWEQTIYARISNAQDCYAVAEVHLEVYAFPESFINETLILCRDSTVTLSAPAGYTYAWNTTPAQITQSITVDEPGSYTVTATSPDGCTATRTFTVTSSGAATDAVFDITDFTGGYNSLTITPVGEGSYEYSLDGEAFQERPVFSNLASGSYTVYVRDVNGCNPVYEEEVFVLDYPKFFTPNGDGVNDIWRIPYLNNRPDITVTVFDRYGKIITGFNGTSPGWDGTLSNKALPSDDYWFRIELEDGRIIKGHFAMVR